MEFPVIWRVAEPQKHARTDGDRGTRSVGMCGLSGFSHWPTLFVLLHDKQLWSLLRLHELSVSKGSQRAKVCCWSGKHCKCGWYNAEKDSTLQWKPALWRFSFLTSLLYRWHPNFGVFVLFCPGLCNSVNSQISQISLFFFIMRVKSFIFLSPVAYLSLQRF